MLVNNAGTIQVRPLSTQIETDFTESLGVMFWGAIYPTPAALRETRAPAGRAHHDDHLGRRQSAYPRLPHIVAKHAAAGFSEGLRVELARDGVQVVSVVPGVLRTGWQTNARFKRQRRRECAWRSLGAALPGFSMDVATPARRIAAATRRGGPELTLTWHTALLARQQPVAQPHSRRPQPAQSRPAGRAACRPRRAVARPRE